MRPSLLAMAVVESARIIGTRRCDTGMPGERQTAWYETIPYSHYQRGPPRMKGVFGLVGLLVALVIVGVLAKKQLQAVRDVSPAAQAGAAPAQTVREQSQQMQQRVQQDVQSAIEQGTRRNAEAAE